MERIAEVWKLWIGIAKAANPDSTYVGNFGESIWTVKDMKTLGDNADWFNADNQGRRPGRPIWMCAQQGRLAKSVVGNKPITNVVAAFAYESNELTRQNSSKAPAEQTTWMAQIAASGMIPWLTWLGGAAEDTRWHEPSRQFFDWHAANWSHLRNKRSLGDVAVLYPQNTISFYGSNGTEDRKLGDLKIEPTDYIQGLYTALVEGHIFFDFAHQHSLSAETLKPYRVPLIPNAAYRRDAECEAIQNYVRAGGSVLATFETSRYNEWGELREDFDLKDIFGVSVAN
jgi:hypothetical protein